MASKVIAHLLRIVGINGNVIELTVILRRIGEQLDILLVINLDKCNSHRAIVTFQREWLLKSKKVLVESARFCEIARVEGYMSHAEYSRTGCSRLSQKRSYEQQGGN